MSIAVVQTTTVLGNTGVSSLQSNAFASAVTSGNTVLVTVYGPSVAAGAKIAVTDTEGNTYQPDVGAVYGASGSVDLGTTSPGSEPYIGIWRASNVTGGSSFKVTATLSTGTAGLAVSAMEVSGLANASPVDVTQVNDSAGSTNCSTGSFSTSNANDLILVGASCTYVSVTPTFTAPTGFTDWSKHTQANSAAANGDNGYEVVSSAQSSIDPTWTSSHGTSCAALAVAYKQASSGPVIPVLMSNMRGNFVGRFRGGFSN
jgi:hypothetical protein